jgi:hypothetical protein
MISAICRSRLALALGAVAALAGCSPQPLAPAYKIQDFITSITARNGQVLGTVVDGDAPPSAGGPAATVDGISTVVNGGSAGVDLAAPSTFQRVYVYSPAASGYYDLQLPSGVTLEDLVLSVSPEVRPGTIRVRYGAEGGGIVGPYAEQSLRVLGVGTGDVQVSVAWNGKTDVDLHVVDPNGEEIYYAHKTAASGGRLDLDSNPACQIDNKNNENVFFPKDTSPHGTYKVYVYYYDACNQAKSDWVVTVLVKGQPTQTFRGTFTGDAASNPPVLVSTFTY